MLSGDGREAVAGDCGGYFGVKVLFEVIFKFVSCNDKRIYEGMLNIKGFLGILRQREIECNFKRMLNRIDGLEFFIDNLLKGQGIQYIYLVLDIRVSREIYQIIIDALKKSRYRNRIRYCVKNEIRLSKSDRNIYFVLFDTPSFRQYLYLNKKIFLTLKELSIMNDREGLLKTNIPPIFNTIENCFENVGVYFTHSFGKKVFSYLRNNTNISVTCINEELKVNRQGYTLKKEYDIILFLDLLESEKVKNEVTGKEYLCLFWKEILNLYNLNYLYDVSTQIIPRLIEKGVKVIIAQPVNLRTSRYVSEAVETSNKRDHGARYWTLNKRYRFNGKLIQDEKLGEALANTKGDLSKGYFRRFHIGDSYNFVNGFRIVHNESKAPNNMYFFGSCISCSAWAKDEDTLCNLIAKEVSPYYNVYSKTNNIENMNLIMRECFYKKNDIVFLFFEELFRYGHMKDVYSFNLDKCFRSVPDLGIHMLDGMWQHIDKVAIKVLADHIIDFVAEKKLIKTDSNNKIETQSFSLVHYGKRPMNIEMYADNNLRKWLYEISPLKREGVNGAIVMNCNPMTLGHLYLIEQAKKRVDNLYIFVVEEDSSEFSFSDRIDIVRNNLKDVENVIVLPSGKYILSADTLEGYFTKKDFCGASIDASEDLELFLTIAQYMGITYRFVGSEPKDKFTRLYNEAMKEKLPEYGVNVVEIERLKYGNRFVSASDVREFIADKNWDAIKGIVPPYTYRFIINKYEDSEV